MGAMGASWSCFSMDTGVELALQRTPDGAVSSVQLVGTGLLPPAPRLR
jgi:hypothetical protein